MKSTREITTVYTNAGALSIEKITHKTIMLTSEDYGSHELTHHEAKELAEVLLELANG